MRFELAWRDREVGTGQTPRRFLDYVIDGEGLYERHEHDVVSSLGWLQPEHDEGAAQRLLCKDAPDLDGRVAVCVCPEDADLLCGAITVIIERDGREVKWRGMAYSWPDWDKTEWTRQAWNHDPAGFEEWQDLRFPSAAYEQAIVSRPRP